MAKKIGKTSSMKFVDHKETYGRHILNTAIKRVSSPISTCLDIGCGEGDDLLVVKKHMPECNLFGIDYGLFNSKILKERNIELIQSDIEKYELGFENESLDFIIANQVLEHTKEIFWINHEIFRALKVGGFLFMGVPNVLSLHNRMLGMIGVHPTQAKMISAHIRTFSKNDTILFYNAISGGFSKIVGFWGSQFYPFPKNVSRVCSRIFPSLSFSIFFLIQKTQPYNNEFVDFFDTGEVATNFRRSAAEVM